MYSASTNNRTHARRRAPSSTSCLPRALLLPALFFLATPAPAKLLSFDNCVANRPPPCLPPRTCVDQDASGRDKFEPCKPASDACLCVSRAQLAAGCASSAACSPNEACVRLRSNPIATTCVSCAVVPVLAGPGGTITLVDPAAACPTASPSPRPRGAARTLDACDERAHCAPGLRCTPLLDRVACGSLGAACVCLPPSQLVPLSRRLRSCRVEACPPGEICMHRRGAPGNSGGGNNATIPRLVCVSATFAASSGVQAIARVGTNGRLALPPLPTRSPTPTPFAFDRQIAPTATGSSGANADPPICIAARHLAALPTHELVFRAHRPARVLCDRAGSCATPGHVVVVGGAPMTMRRYCASAGCTRRRVLVNSPTMRRGRRVRSLTDGLWFTALASSREVFVEEVALRLLVHLGF